MCCVNKTRAPYVPEETGRATGTLSIVALQTELELAMPAKSKKQQMAAGAALAAKRGERPKSSLRGASKQMASSMSEKELHRMASAKRKNLPRRSRAK
jgi:hypothetical protein